MEQMSEIRKEMRDILNKLPGPKGPPKGSFYDLGSGRDKIPRRKRGAQPGNQNARKLGFYSKHFTPGQMKQLKGAAALKDLGPEIALLRVKLNSLLNGPEVSHQLILRAINALARLTAIQRQNIYG